MPEHKRRVCVCYAPNVYKCNIVSVCTQKNDFSSKTQCDENVFGITLYVVYGLMHWLLIGGFHRPQGVRHMKAACLNRFSFSILNSLSSETLPSFCKNL